MDWLVGWPGGRSGPGLPSSINGYTGTKIDWDGEERGVRGGGADGVDVGEGQGWN